MKKRVLGPKFFAQDADIVAPLLLGKYLVRKRGNKTEAYKIIETEAYLGAHDLASHARHGKTKRNSPMYGPPGYWYVYLVYGLHNLLNIITGPEGEPSAVLIRGIGGFPKPGLLTRKILVDVRLTDTPATQAEGLWIEDRGEIVDTKRIKRGPRIGVAYAGAWAKKPFRFLLEE